MLILWHDEQPINDEMTKWKGTISGLSQTHSTASPGRLKAEAAELAQEKVCPIYHNATDNQGVMAKVRLCARIACCRCTGGRSLQN